MKRVVFVVALLAAFGAGWIVNDVTDSHECRTPHAGAGIYAQSNSGGIYDTPDEVALICD